MADDRQLIADLDSCVLAYQVYNQTLIWPLDPWYEAWSRIGSSRRDNMLAAVHRVVADGNPLLLGPGSCRPGWMSDTGLDPVLTDARQLRPWSPCITYDGIEYRMLAASRPLTDRVIDTRWCTYTSPVGTTVARGAGQPVLGEPISSPTAAGDDHLYVFEGGTGSVEGNPHAWGPLGILIDRAAADGSYDVEITFRGSQSGSAYRAAFEGFVREGGNPDWVTDMEVFKLVHDPIISPEGRVLRGIRDAVGSSLAALGRCAEDVQARRGGPPTRIRFTGHSLGGALAVHAAASLGAGRGAELLGAVVSGWPWTDAQVTTFASPKVGDEQFAALVERTLDITRVWVEGDPITRFPQHAHAGTPVELASETSGPRTHEPSVIRDALVARHAPGPSDELANPESPPWRAHESLGAALADAEHTGVAVADLFSPHFVEWCDLFVSLAGDVIGARSSYRVPWTKTRHELRRRRRQLLALFDGSTRSIAELSSRVEAMAGVQPDSDLEDHLRRLLIIREAVRHRWSLAQLGAHAPVALALGIPPTGPTMRGPSSADEAKVDRLIAMRTRHHRTVDQGSVRRFRIRHVPTSAMPGLLRASERYRSLPWAPKELVVPDRLPPEARLPWTYMASYYGLGKLRWQQYQRDPVDPDVEWHPSFRWNHAFPPTGDGWEDPSADATFARLRLQGPNPFLLRRAGDDASSGQPVYELDHGPGLSGVLPPIRARFTHDPERRRLEPLDIAIGAHRHRPGDPTWDDAKRVVNAADARHVVFSRHLLDVHLVVGQAYALATFALPTWHRLRPFMQFFTYATIQVNDMAYRALLSPSSYFISSRFVDVADARRIFTNRIETFAIDEWSVPRDLERRGLLDLAGMHPYVDDALLVWPAFVEVVEHHLDDLRLDDAAIRADVDLQRWYDTLAGLLPNTDPGPRLDRARLSELCTALLWNNVVHEICGDLSPILGSEDPADKAIINLPALRRTIGDGSLSGPRRAPTMGEVFLLDQASYVSRFNVGGNNILRINGARGVDDPKLRVGIERLQSTLRDLDEELVGRNQRRSISFGRMLPRHWEASISF